MRDFTLKKYLELCKILKKREIYTVKSYLQKKPEKDFIILRHDVDRFPSMALDMAEKEKDMSISSTYYFRYSKDLLKNDLVTQFQELGHEVGYHYEVLSKAAGNQETAMQIFQNEITEFRKKAEISTISMHGKPLSKHNNSDIWNKSDFHNYDVIGDAGISIKDIPYFTDTGRSWANENNLRDFLNNQKQSHPPISSTDQLIHQIESSNKPHYISTHPERWPKTFTGYIRSYTIDLTFNVGKWLIRRIRM